MPTRRCNGATALVAEDDAQTRARIAAALREKGFVVSEARDGVELIELVHAAQCEDGSAPDLIVTGAKLPGAGGFEALIGLGRIIATTAVLVISAIGVGDANRLARTAGSLAVLEASYEDETLQRAAVSAVRSPDRPR